MDAATSAKDVIIFAVETYLNMKQWFTFLEPAEPPPKTYTTKGKFEYFKPCIQVEMDSPEKYDTITDIFIRGMLHLSIFTNIWLCEKWSKSDNNVYSSLVLQVGK